MLEYKKISKNDLEQVIKNASLKIGVNSETFLACLGPKSFYEKMWVIASEK